ncbi:unnamed protein product [Rangifer tarandus platyrhynchus]|uniref:Uncharacterized protein n=1 Tax=Rangifer tarandus platyrhynchus TaxID=3082113 RepID=A0AC59ZFL1_RANTA
MKVKSESEVAQSCPAPSDPMDCSPPGSSAHGIFQARVLEWVSIAFSNIQTLIFISLWLAFHLCNSHLMVTIWLLQLQKKGEERHQQAVFLHLSLFIRKHIIFFKTMPAVFLMCQ